MCGQLILHKSQNVIKQRNIFTSSRDAETTRYLYGKKKKRILTPNSAAAAKSLQSCLTLRDPIDGSLPGSPVPGIIQARTLEWVAISFSNA